MDADKPDNVEAASLNTAEAGSEQEKEESEQDMQLRNVLRAHAFHDKHVRYSQAMSFLVQALLTVANGEAPREGASAEATAFGLLTSLMNDFGCRALFAQGMSGLIWISWFFAICCTVWHRQKATHGV